jgi:anti-sigma regulatory factor (Ser/Thr protein kinase)
LAQALCWSQQITLPPAGASVAAARGFVQDHLTEHDLAYLVEDVRLVASELATNACRHAKTPFTVTIARTEGQLRLSVGDDSDQRPLLAAVSTTETNGRGLTIVSGHSRTWGVEEVEGHVKSVWASFDVP